MPAEPVECATVIVPITSDKGLCGAVNSTVVRQVKNLVKESNARSKMQIFSVGDKGSVAMVRPFPDLLKVSISKIGTPYNYPTVMAMAVHIAQMS